MKASALLSGGGGLALYEECAASILSFNLFCCLVAPLQLCSMELYGFLLEIRAPCLRETGLPCVVLFSVPKTE